MYFLTIFFGFFETMAFLSGVDFSIYSCDSWVASYSYELLALEFSPLVLVFSDTSYLWLLPTGGFTFTTMALSSLYARSFKMLRLVLSLF